MEESIKAHVIWVKRTIKYNNLAQIYYVGLANALIIIQRTPN